MNCKNCGHDVEGNFCSNCGQSLKVGRINLPNFIKEVSEGIFQVNKGFFYTLRALFTKPGKSLRGFLNGKRKQHFKPITYVITLSTVYFLSAQLTDQNTWMDDIISGWMNAELENVEDVKIPPILAWFSKNYAYTTLLLLPFFSLASYLSFFKYGKNYLEHIVINSYITGQQAIIYTIFTILGAPFENNIIESLPILLAIPYTFWAFIQFFNEGNSIVIFLRTILSYILYLFFSSALLVLLMEVSFRD